MEVHTGVRRREAAETGRDLERAVQYGDTADEYSLAHPHGRRTLRQLEETLRDATHVDSNPIELCR